MRAALPSTSHGQRRRRPLAVFNRSWVSAARLSGWAAVVAASAGAVLGWGTPHTEITRFGLRFVDGADWLSNRIGGLRPMEDLAWGADYRGDLNPGWYVDDYLLMPGVPDHLSHLMPEVRRTWVPYFRRTVQALREESPANAARWLGSFLHFVEDSGSPPHAFPTGGLAHTRMENYVLSLDIRLPAYRPEPRWGGSATAPESLERSVVERLDRLVDYSAERGRRLKPLAERDDRTACEPLVLESCKETIRAVADVTSAAVDLARQPAPPESGGWIGEVEAPPHPELGDAPVRVVLSGGPHSTIAEPLSRGDIGTASRYRFVFRGLPRGDYRGWVERPGCALAPVSVAVRPNRVAQTQTRLPVDGSGGNLIRNPSGILKWIDPSRPDHWRRVGGEWRTDPIPVRRQSAYRVGSLTAAGESPVRLRFAVDPAGTDAGSPRFFTSGSVLTAPERWVSLGVPGERPPLRAWLEPVTPPPLER